MTRYLALRPLYEYWEHGAMVRHSVGILSRDGYEGAHKILLPHLDTLARGSVDADLPWTFGYVLHFYHYHHPWSHRGYLTQESAAGVLQDLFWQSVDLWGEGQEQRAAYQLGRSVHLLQDLFVPHHAGLTAFRNHGDYERFVTGRWRQFAPAGGGHYRWSRRFRFPLCTSVHRLSWQRPYDWVDMAAHLSYPWLGALDGSVCPAYRLRFLDATARLIPELLRFTAGYLNRFAYQVETHPV